MGRPREFDRATALERAMEVFWARGGYERTSITRLTRAMDISSPSLYATYHDKPSLYRDALAEYRATPAMVSHWSITEATALDVIETMLESAVAQYTAPGHPSGCMILADPSLIEERRAMHAAISERMLQAVTDGDLGNTVDPSALAQYILVLLSGLSARARDGASRAELQKVADIAKMGWRAIVVDNGSISPG